MQSIKRFVHAKNNRVWSITIKAIRRKEIKTNVGKTDGLASP